MSNEMAIQALIEYLEESDEPELYWSKHEFLEVSSSRWAAGELIEAIMDHPFVSAEDTIEAFGLKMLACALMWSKGSEQGLIFKTASDFAFECLELFREEKTFYDKRNPCQCVEEHTESSEKAQS